MGVPEMDSHEGDRQGSPVKRTNNHGAADKKVKEGGNGKGEGEEKELGLFEMSPSSTFKDLQRKLDQVQSPSESKVSESHTTDQIS